MRRIVKRFLPYLWFRKRNAPRKWEGESVTEAATDEICRRQCLYRNLKGRYWLQDWTSWNTPIPHGRWVRSEEAARWLQHNGHRIPLALAKKVSAKANR